MDMGEWTNTSAKGERDRRFITMATLLFRQRDLIRIQIMKHTIFTQMEILLLSCFTLIVI
jgi:proline dehydrogenase